MLLHFYAPFFLNQTFFKPGMVCAGVGQVKSVFVAAMGECCSKTGGLEKK